MTRGRGKPNSSPGKFLPTSQRGQGQAMPSPKQPFIPHKGVDRTVKAKQGMLDSSITKEGVFIDVQSVHDQLGNIGVAQDDLAIIIGNAVETAVKAAIPAIVRAVREACVASVKEDINPHLLRSQFERDEVDQQMRRENLRIIGLTEGQVGQAETEENAGESEEALMGKVCQLAEEVGVNITPDDISTCYRVGKPRVGGGGARQTIVRLISRRKRDEIYNRKYALKGKTSYKGVFVNDDLTPLRYSVLRSAKNSPLVKNISTKNGNIVCKMQDDTFKVIKTPDDLFDVGLTDIKYEDFKLSIM